MFRMKEKENGWAVYFYQKNEKFCPRGVARVVGHLEDSCCLDRFDDFYITDVYQSKDVREFNSFLGAVGYFFKNSEEKNTFEIIRNLANNFPKEKNNLDKFLGAFENSVKEPYYINF